MTSSALARARIAKAQVSNERTNRDGKHDPSIIRHKQQPVYGQSVARSTGREGKSNSHDKERVKDLQRIERRLDDLRLLVDRHLALP